MFYRDTPTEVSTLVSYLGWSTQLWLLKLKNYEPGGTQSMKVLQTYKYH